MFLCACAHLHSLYDQIFHCFYSSRTPSYRKVLLNCAHSRPNIFFTFVYPMHNPAGLCPVLTSLTQINQKRTPQRAKEKQDAVCMFIGTLFYKPTPPLPFSPKFCFSSASHHCWCCPRFPCSCCCCCCCCCCWLLCLCLRVRMLMVGLGAGSLGA